MTQVTVADIAQDFSAQHAVGTVGFFANVIAVDGHKIARPAATRIKPGVRGEERGATAYTAVNAMFVVIPIAPGKRPFSAFLASDVIFFGRELGFPFCISFNDFFHVGGSSANV